MRVDELVKINNQTQGIPSTRLAGVRNDNGRRFRLTSARAESGDLIAPDHLQTDTSKLKLKQQPDAASSVRMFAVASLFETWFLPKVRRQQARQIKERSFTL